MLRAALLQTTSSDRPPENLAMLTEMIDAAAAGGATFALTPEVSNCVSADRAHQATVLQPEAEDPVLAGLRDAAARHGIWVLAGSLAVKSGDADGRFANRSFLIAPDGHIAARYDKIHMFDVQISDTESYRESAGYRPGDRAVVARTDAAMLGMTICYDVRFPHLYRMLAEAGAQIITVPSAFSPVTGAAHWESLLRARAIETGCYVLAPAQTGSHAASAGRPRTTHGHSLAVSPWGEVLVDAGTEPGVSYVDIDLAQVAEARRRVPSLQHVRPIAAPGGVDHSGAVLAVT